MINPEESQPLFLNVWNTPSVTNNQDEGPRKSLMQTNKDSKKELNKHQEQYSVSLRKNKRQEKINDNRMKMLRSNTIEK